MPRPKGKSLAKPVTPVQAVAVHALPKTVQIALAELTPLQQRFVFHYCGQARANGVLAAGLAGIKGKYAARAAQASNWLREPRVRDAIEAWMEAFALTAVQLTASLVDLAQVDMGPFVTISKDGTVRIKVRDDVTWQAHKHWIKALEADPETGRVTRLVLHDPLVAKRELAKIMKLYSDAPQVQVHLHLQQMSDDELLHELELARDGATSAATH